MGVDKGFGVDFILYQMQRNFRHTHIYALSIANVKSAPPPALSAKPTRKLVSPQ